MSTTAVRRSGNEPHAGRSRVVILALGVIVWPAGAEADWMVGAFLGHAWTLKSAVRLTLPAQRTDIEMHALEYRAESFRSPPYYGYRLTWTPNGEPRIGIEAEFIHMKVFGRTDRPTHVRGILQGVPVDGVFPAETVVQRLVMSHGLNFVLANVVFRHGTRSSGAPQRRAVVTVLRAGTGVTVPHAESTIDGVSREQYDGGGIGVQAAGGVEAAVTEHVLVLAEYKFTWASPTIDVAGGQATIPARSHHVVAGLAYRF